jgi:hypothetical protein
MQGNRSKCSETPGFPQRGGERRNVRRTPVDAPGMVLLIIVAAVALFGIGCTILGLLAGRRRKSTKR